MAGFFYYRRGPLGPVQPNESIDMARVNNNRRPGNTPPENRGDRSPGNRPAENRGDRGPGNMPPRNDGGRGPGNMPPRNDGGRGPGNMPPRNDGGRGPGNMPPRNDGGRGPGNMPPRNDGGRGPGNMPPRNDRGRRPGSMPPGRPPQNNYGRPSEPYGRRNNMPPGPPPTEKPTKKKNYGNYAVNPGAMRLCQNRYTYVWLNDGREFWIWLAYVGRRSIAGYRWSWGRQRWVVFGTDISNINEFECY